MDKSRGTRRKILTAGAGIAVYTALEGLACGNPVAPGCPPAGCREPMMEQPRDAQESAAATDGGVAPGQDAGVAPTPAATDAGVAPTTP
jgi:hypothetical protein